MINVYDNNPRALHICKKKIQLHCSTLENIFEKHICFRYVRFIVS